MQNIYLVYFSCCTRSLHTNGYYITVKEVSYLHLKYKKYLKEYLSENHKWNRSKQQKAGMHKQECVLRKTDIIIKQKAKSSRIYYSCSPHALVDLQSLLKNKNLLSCCFITLATYPPCQQLHRRQQSKQQHRDSSGLDPELSSCPLENDETRSIYWCHFASWHLQRKWAKFHYRNTNI